MATPQTIHAIPARRSRGSGLRVGLLGCGVVGSEVARLLLESDSRGFPGELVHVAVKHPDKPRRVNFPEAMLTTDTHRVVTDPGVDVVIEVIGGIEPARTLIVASIESGKSVVTANKELLARHGTDLFALASEHGVDIAFEASVCGAVPIVRALRESLAGDRIDRIVGIVNGTTNYILTQMADEGCSFNRALARARELGYAEADAAADLDGLDAAAKLAILASLAFGTNATISDVCRRGIGAISRSDIEAAHRFGYVVKLVAVAERHPDGVSLSVGPAVVPTAHPLAEVRNEYNCVIVDAQAAGRLTFSGPGAGGEPTASAVIGDLVSAARNGGASATTRRSVTAQELVVFDETASRHFLRLVGAASGDLSATVAAAFARREVAIRRMAPDEGRLLVDTEPVSGPTLDRIVADLAPEDIVTEARLRIFDD